MFLGTLCDACTNNVYNAIFSGLGSRLPFTTKATPKKYLVSSKPMGSSQRVIQLCSIQRNLDIPPIKISHAWPLSSKLNASAVRSTWREYSEIGLP